MSVRNAILSRFYRFLPDKTYLRLKFKRKLGTPLNLENPRTFNEKLQWLKLRDRRPEYTVMVDKYKVRELVAEKIGEEYLIPLLGVWDDPDEIDFDALPARFVLKCNHNSAVGLCICRDKSTLDVARAKAELRRGLRQNYYWRGREWPYKNVPRKIIAEKLMSDGRGAELTDYKFMCFNGEVKCAFTCTNRRSANGLNVTFFDQNWERLPFVRHYPADPEKIEKPKSFEKMIEASKILAANIPFSRIDFYEIDGKPYFGEITLFPGGGFEEFTPAEWDRKLGDWLTLPREAKR